MAEVEQELFAVCVFKDVAWAERGIEALKQQGFDPAGLSLVSKDVPEAVGLVERIAGTAPERLDLPAIGPSVVRGTLVSTLQGQGHDLGRVGMAAAMRRAGYQPHDGLIYETLIGRGGVLVAFQGALRAADALAVMLNYGGGNAAIGAWTGRV